VLINLRRSDRGFSSSLVRSSSKSSLFLMQLRNRQDN